MSDLPTRNEWEELGFSVPDELCAPTMEYESLPLEHCAEYDGAAEWCAIRGLKGKVGDPLPANMATNGALKYINADPEAFEERVRQFAYARAMSRVNLRDIFKSMRLAVNALDDGLPRLAQEILGDTLRAYGEEQP